VIAFSAALHLALLLYAQHVDTHPERYGGLKYTDVDWRVVIDGARHIWSRSGEGDVADGWLGRWLNDRGVQLGE
jgi:phosphatidylinositol glycan class M